MVTDPTQDPGEQMVVVRGLGTNRLVRVVAAPGLWWNVLWRQRGPLTTGDAALGWLCNIYLAAIAAAAFLLGGTTVGVIATAFDVATLAIIAIAFGWKPWDGPEEPVPRAMLRRGGD